VLVPILLSQLARLVLVVALLPATAKRLTFGIADNAKGNTGSLFA
jgi:hypothetical protein